MANGNKWFTIGMTIITLLLCAVGALVIIVNTQTKELVIISNNQIKEMVIGLNNQTWDKLNRMTDLFMNERNIMNDRIDKTCDKVERLQIEHQKDMKEWERRK